VIRSVLCLAVCAGIAGLAPSAFSAQRPSVYVIDHVADGDTVTLRNGQRVRLVQIDTPEVYFGAECYGPQASATTKRLLAPGTRVRLLAEPATDRCDQYGRLLRYVVRTKDGLNVNVQLVRVGAAAPTSTKVGGADTQPCSSGSRSVQGGSISASGGPARTPRTTPPEASRRLRQAQPAGWGRGAMAGDPPQV
jgi:micrococcal nuclease